MGRGVVERHLEWLSQQKNWFEFNKNVDLLIIKKYVGRFGRSKLLIRFRRRACLKKCGTLRRDRLKASLCFNKKNSRVLPSRFDSGQKPDRSTLNDEN